MNGDFEYSENFDAFLKMLNEQQNKIKSVLSDNANLLSLNTLKIPEINISKIDSDPLGAKLKGAFNIDVGAGKQLRSAVEKINTERVREVQNALDNISSTTERICNIFTKEFRDFLSNVGIRIRESLLLELSIFGELEWCYWGVHELDDSKLWDMSPTYLKEYLDENKNASVKDIDAYITKYFTKKIIISIADRTALNLDKNDSKKFNQAMIDFRARRYLDCANLLASLIDAQSIKQEIFDMNNNKYRDAPANIAQGWQAFSIVFYNDLAEFFDGKDFKAKRGDKKKREEKFEIFIDEIKNNLSNYETKIPILLLASCLIKFFEDSNWKNYPQKPEVINRHWLMHGMYDIDDITKSDCIKLLLMLNQLTDIYPKIKKGEL